jgi:hypothetical protein
VPWRSSPRRSRSLIKRSETPSGQPLPKRLPAGHNPQAKSPVFAKAKPPPGPSGAVLTEPTLYKYSAELTIIENYAALDCKRNIEMAPLCKVEMTLPPVAISATCARPGETTHPGLFRCTL